LSRAARFASTEIAAGRLTRTGLVAVPLHRRSGRNRWKSWNFQGLIDQLGELTDGQSTALIGAVRAKASATDAVSLIDRRFAAAPRCPHCRSVAVGTQSKPEPLTRYKCHDCRRTFTGLTGTPLERLRRGDAWLAYAQALADGVSLRKAAKRCGIVLDTSFRWRHRFLQLPKQMKATAISGMVEVDETYFLRSQKGARKVVGRKARKRGGKASRPGLSDEHAAVLIARDRTGATTDTVLDKADTGNITRHLGGVVQKDTLLISGGEKAYGAFAAALGLLHVGSSPRKASTSGGAITSRTSTPTPAGSRHG
jgi:transposase-like protein